MQSKINKLNKPIHCQACSKVLIKISRFDILTPIGLSHFIFDVKCANCGKRNIIEIKYIQKIEIVNIF